MDKNAIGYATFQQLVEGADAPEEVWYKVVDGMLLAIVKLRICKNFHNHLADSWCYRHIAVIGETVGERWDYIQKPILMDGASWAYAASMGPAGNWSDWQVISDGGRNPFFCKRVIGLHLYRGKPLYIGTHDTPHNKAVLYYDHRPVWYPPPSGSWSLTLEGDQLTVVCYNMAPIVIKDARIFLKLPIHEPPKTGPYR